VSKIDDRDGDDLFEDDVLDDEFSEEEATSETETPDPEPAKEETPAKTESASGEDKESYGRKVQKRIDKLTREKRELEMRVQQMQAKVETIEAKHTAREYSEFQQQVAYSEHQVKSQLDAARAEYRKAVEEGDIDAQLAAQDKMFELREQWAEKRRMTELAKEQVQKLQQQPAPEQQPADAPTIPENFPEGTRAWLKRNRWYADGSDPKAAAYARQLDADLQEEGFSPDDPEMYQELDRRLHAVVPRLAKKSALAEKVADASPARPAPKARVAGSSADGQSTAESRTPARRLTQGDLETMRKYGFDPNKPDHRKAWIKRNDPL
jgi:hypothetical protein